MKNIYTVLGYEENTFKVFFLLHLPLFKSFLRIENQEKIPDTYFNPLLTLVVFNHAAYDYKLK
jgi:hypothetical protein